MTVIGKIIYEQMVIRLKEFPAKRLTESDPRYVIDMRYETPVQVFQRWRAGGGGDWVGII